MYLPLRTGADLSSSCAPGPVQKWLWADLSLSMAPPEMAVGRSVSLHGKCQPRQSRGPHSRREETTLPSPAPDTRGDRECQGIAPGCAPSSPRRASPGGRLCRPSLLSCMRSAHMGDSHGTGDSHSDMRTVMLTCCSVYPGDGRTGTGGPIYQDKSSPRQAQARSSGSGCLLLTSASRYLITSGSFLSSSLQPSQPLCDSEHHTSLARAPISATGFQGPCSREGSDPALRATATSSRPGCRVQHPR